MKKKTQLKRQQNNKILRNKAKGAGEVAQLLRPLAILIDDSSSLPSTHMVVQSSIPPVPGNLTFFVGGGVQGNDTIID